MTHDPTERLQILALHDLTARAELARIWTRRGDGRGELVGLTVEPSRVGWDGLIYRLDTFPHASQALLCHWLDPFLSHWPDDFRELSVERSRELLIGMAHHLRPSPLMRLCRMFGTEHVYYSHDPIFSHERVCLPLSTSMAFANLRGLNLDMMNVNDASVAALAQSPHLIRLTSLSLARNSITDEGLAALAASPNFAHLTSLDLGDNNFGYDGLIALSRSLSIRNLTHLDISWREGSPSRTIPRVREAIDALIASGTLHPSANVDLYGREEPKLY